MTGMRIREASSLCTTLAGVGKYFEPYRHHCQEPKFEFTLVGLTLEATHSIQTVSAQQALIRLWRTYPSREAKVPNNLQFLARQPSLRQLE